MTSSSEKSGCHTSKISTILHKAATSGTRQRAGGARIRMSQLSRGRTVGASRAVAMRSRASGLQGTGCCRHRATPHAQTSHRTRSTCPRLARACPRPRAAGCLSRRSAGGDSVASCSLAPCARSRACPAEAPRKTHAAVHSLSVDHARRARSGGRASTLKAAPTGSNGSQQDTLYWRGATRSMSAQVLGQLVQFSSKRWLCRKR